MNRPLPRLLAASLAILLCGGATRATAQNAPDTGRFRYSAADVEFMSGMIHHHAQAVLMAGWAESHGASPAVHTLCDRIVVAQRDEIALMQRWLRDRNQPVPEADPMHDVMPGMEHLMPGMLTGPQLAKLDSARGPEFDRLFLTDMIRHHQGAIAMVNQLLASQGAGEEEAVFRFSSDVYADQTTEIARMQRMLAALLIDVPSGR
ncbi:MAG TPA: DUF305 domain-containing protein [Gemmatimonadales bacterium]